MSNAVKEEAVGNIYFQNKLCVNASGIKSLPH